MKKLGHRAPDSLGCRFGGFIPLGIFGAVCLFVSGCGNDWAPRYIDPAIADRVEAFEARTGHEVISSVFLADMPTGTILESRELGRCIIDDGARPVILISDSIGGSALDAVLWHEIGHCDLGLGHAPPDEITALLVEGLPLPVILAPASIMAADITGAIFAMEHGYSEFYLCSLGVCE